MNGGSGWVGDGDCLLHRVLYGLGQVGEGTEAPGPFRFACFVVLVHVPTNVRILGDAFSKQLVCIF